jgi:hypothetical protein
MKSHPPFRLPLGAALMLLCATLPAFARFQKQKNAPPPVVLKPNGQPRPAVVRPAQPNGEGNRAAQNQHLAQWMDNHKALSLSDQQRALQNEPGFRELPRETQQRQLDQLARLNAMNPQQRARILDRNEVLERMSPPQREQWRGAVQQLNALPMPRRRLMARAILDLREMSPDQRQQVINSPAMRSQFSDPERATLSTLLSAEPYNPAP